MSAAPKSTVDSYRRIWSAVRRIPRGRVSTYGAVARMSGFPGQARIVGYALHRLPSHADVPWHRVVNARGTISLPGSSGERQRSLLRKEGVVMRMGRIDLSRYGWTGSVTP